MAVPACYLDQNRKYEICFSVCPLNKICEVRTDKTKQQKPSRLWGSNHHQTLLSLRKWSKVTKKVLPKCISI